MRIFLINLNKIRIIPKFLHQDYNDHKNFCLKSKGIVPKLISGDPLKKSSNKISNSHIVRDLNNMRQKRLAREAAFKKPTTSVQQRLKNACLKEDFKVQPSVTVKVPDSNNVSDSLKKETISPSIAIKDEIIVIENKPTAPKWKNYEIPTKLDEDCYFEAIITDFGTPKLGYQSYIVSPVEFKDQYINHLRQLQQVYESSALKSLSRDGIKKKDLVVALLGITWHRAIVLEVNDTMVVVRSIETGTTVDIDVKDLCKIKAPLPAELQKKAFTMEVIFENGQEIEVDLNRVVSIKMMTNLSGTNSAMLKINDNIFDKKVDNSKDSKHDNVFKKFETISIRDKPDILFDFKAFSDGTVEQKVVNKVEVTSADVRTTQNKSFDDRKYLNSQMVKDFHTGDNIKLTFLDGSHLSKGLAHFCENRPENVEFYRKIGKFN